MKMVDIKQKAFALGVKPGRMKKSELIKAVQRREGKIPCFTMAANYCDQYDCCWREDCLPQENRTDVMASEF